MTLQLTQQMYQEPYYVEPRVRKTDIQFSLGADSVIIGLWVVLGLMGLAIISILDMPVLGTIFIGVPTFALMVLKPTLGLFIFALVLPTGSGFAFQQIFSLTKGVGLALAISFFLNVLLTRPHLKRRNKTIWAAGLFMIWVTFCSLVSPHMRLELSTRALTGFQLFGLMLISYWIVETNGLKSLIWVLRGYVLGSMATNVGAVLTGKAMESVYAGSQARYAATLGQAGSENVLAAITGVAFLTAVYLFIRDRSLLWRVFYLVAILFLPLIMLKIGSRSSFLALGVAFIVTLVLSSVVRRHPKLVLGFLLLFIIAGGASFFFIERGGLQEQQQVAERLTDIEYAKQSISYRLFLMKKAVNAAVNYPLGTGHWSWFERTGLEHWPHSGLFHIMGVYGLLGIFIFALMLFFVFMTIMRIPPGPEKFYCLALFTFLVVASQANVLNFKKIYWLIIGIIMACEWVTPLFEQEEPPYYLEQENNFL